MPKYMKFLGVGISKPLANTKLVVLCILCLMGVILVCEILAELLKNMINSSRTHDFILN